MKNKRITNRLSKQTRQLMTEENEQLWRSFCVDDDFDEVIELHLEIFQNIPENKE